MAVRIEPPRGRQSGLDPARYPGLTPEERGLEPGPELAPPELAPPLWVAPSNVPPASRPVGFVALPPQPAPTVDGGAPEGLFDVPGLLERLWLARALEASHHERSVVPSPAPLATPPAPPSPPAPAPPLARSGGVAVVLRPIPFAMPMPRREPAAVPLAPPSAGLRAGPPAAPPTPVRHPSSWVCPYCYLANDPAATTCRGCRSSSLHL